MMSMAAGSPMQGSVNMRLVRDELLNPLSDVIESHSIRGIHRRALDGSLTTGGGTSMQTVASSFHNEGMGALLISGLVLVEAPELPGVET